MIVGIVLAAGLGRRIGMPKALLTVDGETFHHCAIRTFAEAGFDSMVVVNAVVNESLPAPAPGEQRVVNADPDQPEGMFASVRLGVGQARARGASGAILLPVDHPLIRTDDIRAVAAELRKGILIVVAAHDGRRGHPIGMSSEIMDEIVRDSTALTLRDVVRRDPRRVVQVEVSEGATSGVNTKEDLERVSNRPFR